MEKSEPIKVLIAEDEDSFRMVLQRVLLSNEIYEFEACASGDEVLELLNDKHYDVIILDHKMPGRSGLNILQWMHEQKMDTPVIMLTGAGSENIAVEAMKLGAYDYIRKEIFEKEHLPHVINSAHERYLFRKERELRQSVVEERKRSTETFELLLSCVRSFEELMNTSLATTNIEIESREKELLTNLPKEQAELLSLTFSRIRQQYETVGLCAKSLVDLAKVMYERLMLAVDTEKREQELKHILHRIEEQSRRGDSSSKEAK